MEDEKRKAKRSEEKQHCGETVTDNIEMREIDDKIRIQR